LCFSTNDCQVNGARALGYFEGNVVKYISRWRKKGGVADLEKAKHYVELLIEMESRNARI